MMPEDLSIDRPGLRSIRNVKHATQEALTGSNAHSTPDDLLLFIQRTARQERP